MTPQEIADHYFAAMVQQNLEALLALFAEGATIVWPDGREITGKAAIREAYLAMFTRPTNNPAPGPLMVGSESFSTQVTSRLQDGSERRTLNVFRLGTDGLITRMDSYKQG